MLRFAIQVGNLSYGLAVLGSPPVAMTTASPRRAPCFLVWARRYITYSPAAAIRLYYNLSVPANMFPALWRSCGVTFRALWRVARQVFHEFAGAMFIIFAAYGVLAAWRQWKTRPVLWLIGIAVIYALLMAIFGLVSFRRARRVR
jgi:hypothetical protein